MRARMRVCVHVCVCTRLHVRVCVCTRADKLPCCHLPVFSSSYLSICRLFIPMPFSLGCVFFYPCDSSPFFSSFSSLLSSSLSYQALSLAAPPTPKALVLLYKGVLNVMMVVGGRVHTGSFDREMSKCVSLCVSVTICVRRCLARRGQGADVMSARACVRDVPLGRPWQRLGRG